MAKIEGRNAVMEAVKAERRKIHQIMIQDTAQGDNIEKISSLARQKKIRVEKVSSEKIEHLSESYAHQGIIALGDDLPYYSPEELVQKARDKNEAPRLLILDRIQDPQNFGALIRTAHAAGMHGVIYPKNRAADITPAVLKASAGSGEYLPLCKVSNINYAIANLKDIGLWIAGTAPEATDYYYDIDLKGALAIVIGNENEGLRRLVKENCDFLLKIPIYGKVGSLNASVAAGVVIFEALRQHEK